MSSSSSLTCNFTISTDLAIGVSFESDDGGANYGGQITIFTPASAGAVTTNLWDNDGNVCFTLYDVAAPVSCTVNSGSDPGSWIPYVTVAESGLSCAVSPPQQTGEGVYDYILTVSTSAAEADETAASAAPPTAQHVATMVLPPGGMEAWTQIMQGSTPVPSRMSAGSPIVMAAATFDDGTQVVAGVYKSDVPTEYNVKFMWALDANGNQYPGYPCDVSDNEDFLATSYTFSLTGSANPEYQLNVVER